MKVETEQLSGAALDWAVAKIADKHVSLKDIHWGNYSPSTNWAQGGPIIEREEIDLLCDVEDETGEATNGNPGWIAQKWTLPLSLGQCLETSGPTPLIAAMRAYITRKLGEEVEIPDELLKT
jgi:Protein of unknown function (DUF2591)